MQEKHEIEKLDLLKTILTKEEYFIKTLEENRLFAVISLIMFLTILFTSPEMISAFWIIIVFMVVSMNEKIKKTRASIISSLVNNTEYSGTWPSHSFIMLSASTKNGLAIRNITKNESFVENTSKLLHLSIFPDA